MSPRMTRDPKALDPSEVRAINDQASALMKQGISERGLSAEALARRRAQEAPVGFVPFFHGVVVAQS
jgi:hypothetical protein